MIVGLLIIQIVRLLKYSAQVASCKLDEIADVFTSLETIWLPCALNN